MSHDHEADDRERDEYELKRRLLLNAENAKLKLDEANEKIARLECQLAESRAKTYLLDVGPLIIKWLREERRHGSPWRQYRDGLATRIEQGEHLEEWP